MSALPDPTETPHKETVISGAFSTVPPGPRLEGWQAGATHNFQPSKAALKRYLATRKDPFNLAGITFPGLFVEPYVADSGWFKIAVGIEVVTALILSAIVVSVYNLPPVAGVLPFLGFVGVDLALAVGHHWPLRRTRCLRENQKLLVIPDLRVGLRRREKSYSDFFNQIEAKAQAWHKWLSLLCVLLIVVMAIGKTLFLSANIQELGTIFRPPSSGNIFASHSSVDEILARNEYRTAILVIFSLLYGLVAYIHINHTGYALARDGFLGVGGLIPGLKRDRRERDTNPRDTKFLCVEYHVSVDLRRLADELQASEDSFYKDAVPRGAELTKALQIGLKVDLTEDEHDAIAPHRIIKQPDGTYEVTRNGVLYDEQLQAWVNMQPTRFAGIAVGLYGHQLQLNMLGGEDIDAEI